MVNNQTYPVDAPLTTCHPHVWRREFERGDILCLRDQLWWQGAACGTCEELWEWWRMMATIHGYNGYQWILTIHQSLAVMTPYDACVQWTPVGLLGVDQPSSLRGAIRFRLGRLECIFCRGLSVAIGVFHGEWEHAACILSWFMSTVVNHGICPKHWIIWIVLGREPPSLMMYAIYRCYIYIYNILVLNNSTWYSWHFSGKSPAISYHFLGRSAKVWTKEVSVGPEGDCATKALSCRVVTRQLAGGSFMTWKHQPLMLWMVFQSLSFNVFYHVLSVFYRFHNTLWYSVQTTCLLRSHIISGGRCTGGSFGIFWGHWRVQMGSTGFGISDQVLMEAELICWYLLITSD